MKLYLAQQTNPPKRGNRPQRGEKEPQTSPQPLQEDCRPRKGACGMQRSQKGGLDEKKGDKSQLRFYLLPVF